MVMLIPIGLHQNGKSTPFIVIYLAFSKFLLHSTVLPVLKELLRGYSFENFDLPPALKRKSK